MNRNTRINNLGVSKPVLRTTCGLLLLLFSGAAIGSAFASRHLPFLPLVVSTVPTNGDQNPYGVAFVPFGFPGPNLKPGDILVSNFNNQANLQGFGTTLLRVRPDGQTSTFANTGSVTGLTAALGIIKQGFVFVGSVETSDGTDAHVTGGPLLILDSNGNVVQSITSPLDGPWGLAINSRDDDHVQVFVSSVLNGTVTRFDFSFPGNTIHLDSRTQIASGYSHTLDPAAIVIGPAGMAYNRRKDILYVAGEDDDKIFAIQDASTTTDHGTGNVIFSDPTHLHGPLGLAIAPNGNLITANNDSINSDPNQPSEIVEFTVTGNFVRQFSIDPNIDGPFDIAIGKFEDANEFAYLNDNRNTLSVWRLDDDMR
jgi:hypothetical protein